MIGKGAMLGGSKGNGLKNIDFNFLSVNKTGL